MTQSQELDIGPLSWVRGEIDQALTLAAEAIDRAEADPEQSGQLQFARTHVHQARGALSMVGLDGLCHFVSTLDDLLGRMSSGQPLDPAHANLARRGCSAVSNYLGELVKGSGDQPLRLYALYREIASANDQQEISPADLFYPDLNRRLPRRKLRNTAQSETEASALRGARAALERGLLQWLRSPADRSGPDTMRDAAIALEAQQSSPAFYTLWRVAQAFFEALAHQDLPASEMRIKQLCAGLAREVRNQENATHRLPERLLRDLLFEVGQAPARTPSQRQVRQAWNLDAWWAEPSEVVTDIPLGPLLRKLRTELSAAKADWDAFGSGNAAALQAFDERIASISEESKRIGRPPLQELLSSVAGVSQWLRSDPAHNGDDALAVEVATALLLSELSVEGGIADSELAAQGKACRSRFDNIMNGDSPTETDALDGARRAHEWDARQQVAREIASNLGHIEQTLDDFFRNHDKRAPLSQLIGPLRQIEGALAVIGGEQAMPLVREAARHVSELANSTFDPDGEQLNQLADQISTLGFFVAALQHGEADLDDFLPPEQRTPPNELDPSFELDFDETIEAHAVAEEDPPPQAPQRPAAPAMVPAPSTDAELDAELLAIFIEEAHEVLGAIAEGLSSTVPHGNADVLVDIRRGFHTLKGSGRMVGLTEFGEAAWAIEQTLNRWLQLERPLTEDLCTLISGSHQSFSAWVSQIESGGSHSFDFSKHAALSERLRSEDEAAPPAAADAVTSLAEPAAAALLEASAARSAEDSKLPLLEMPDSWRDMDAEDEASRASTPPLPPFDFGDLPSLELDGEEVISAPEAPALEPAMQDPLERVEDPGEEPEAALPEETLAAEFAEPEADAPESTAPDATAPVVAPTATVRIGEHELSRQLYELYLNEAHEHLETLTSELKPLRRNPGRPSDKLQRTAHTLAGISGTARIPAMQHLARALEFAFDRLRDNELTPTPEQTDLLSTTVDTLQAMLTEVTRQQLPLEVPELEPQLDSVGRPQAEDPLHDDATDVASAQTFVAEPPTEDAPSLATAASAEPSRTTPVPHTGSPDAEETVSTTVHDDLDEQLLPIFLEEADELMAALSERMRLWQADSSNPEHARMAARDLHTLKGSARMAGAMQLGEHVHRIESRLESNLARQYDAEQLIDELTSGLDHAAQMISALNREDPAGTASATAVESGAEQPSNAAAVITVEAGDAAAEPAQSGGTLRVRADTLGGFINTAGEIGIARTRIEGELRVLRRSLLDLTENVIRLRNQLREVELQAETQMQTRIAQADSTSGEFDPLEMDRYTRLQELTRMMAESVGDVTTVQQQLLRNLDGAELALHSQARFARDLQQSLMQVRMVPFDSLADRLHRVVRQSAKDQSKRVNLDIRGGRIEVDRSVLERVTIAIEHMLRNAVAHGIESTEHRREAGKQEIGQITLSVAQIGNEIAIDLADDGRGLDYAAIRARGIERGLLLADEEADERKLINLIFASGFSTAETVSALAGRGVGMDVVRAEAAALGGRIDVHAREGEGTNFRIYLPLTLAVTQALLVRAGLASYAIPSSMIAQAMELRADAINKVRADGHIEWQGQRFNYRYLPELLGDRRTQAEIGRFNWLLLLRAGSESLAVHVDSLRGNQEIVVKSAGPQLLRVVGISGATVLGDGEIVLILNPIALSSRLAAPGVTITRDDSTAPQVELPHVEVAHVPTVMVVDDSLTVRKITGRLLEREGYRVLTAKDGTDALDQLEEGLPDVILSDIEMPRMDGFELVRNLRADERTREVPVFMITSRLADKHREYAEKLGANEYLGKPYDEEELLSLLQRYVRTGTVQ